MLLPRNYVNDKNVDFCALVLDGTLLGHTLVHGNLMLLILEIHVAYKENLINDSCSYHHACILYDLVLDIVSSSSKNEMFKNDRSSPLLVHVNALLLML